MPLSATDIYIILHLVYKHCVKVLKSDPFIRVEVELELRDSWKDLNSKFFSTIPSSELINERMNECQ